jgi:hypothetical protein
MTDKKTAQNLIIESLLMTLLLQEDARLPSSPTKARRRRKRGKEGQTILAATAFFLWRQSPHQKNETPFYLSRDLSFGARRVPCAGSLERFLLT